MRYSTIKAIIEPMLQADFPKAVVYPGPAMPENPSMAVILTPFGGGAQEVDGLIDAVNWQVRAVGYQNNFESAEDLAWAVDTVLIGLRSGQHGGVHVVSFPRLGGPPSVLMVDNADRHHFVCSYMPTVESALAS